MKKRKGKKNISTLFVCMSNFQLKEEQMWLWWFFLSILDDWVTWKTWFAK